MTQAFDPSSGILTTELREQIGPALSRPAFLASSLAVDAAPLISNEPHASWRIARSLDGRPFRLGLYFEADRLHMVCSRWTIRRSVRTGRTNRAELA